MDEIAISALNNRLDKLERQNRLWRSTALAAISLVAVVLLTGATEPDNAAVPPRTVQASVFAKAFYLTDSTGKHVIAKLAPETDSAALVFFSTADSNHARLDLHAGTLRCGSPNCGTPGELLLAYASGSGGLSLTPGGFMLNNPSGMTRAEMFYDSGRDNASISVGNAQTFADMTGGELDAVSPGGTLNILSTSLAFLAGGQDVYIAPPSPLCPSGSHVACTSGP